MNRQRLHKALNKVWQRGEASQWTYGLMGKIKGGVPVFDVEGRAGYVYVRIRNQSGAQTSPPARNDPGVAHSAGLGVRMRMEGTTLVIDSEVRREDLATTPAPPGSGVGTHIHDTRYFTESEHISVSAGAADAGKAIILNASGEVDASMLPSTVLTDTDDLPEGTTNLYYTDERAQDAVGLMIDDTATVALAYVDATPSLTATVIDGSITYAKMQDVSATDRFLGRDTAGAGDVEEITPAAARTMLNVADGANNYVHPNHTGDVTSVADGATTIGANKVLTAMIADAQVTLAKMANLAADTMIGRANGAGTGVPTALTATQVIAILQSGLDARYVMLTTNQTVAGDKTFTGVTRVGDGTTIAAVIINGAVGAARQFAYQSAGSNRWLEQVSTTAESGSNVGSDYELLSRTDAGGVLATVLRIVRSTGIATWIAKVAAPIFAASTSAGLRLEDDGGNLGMLVEDGGSVQFGGQATFSDPDVAHGMTSLLPTDRWLWILPGDGLTGGAQFIGLSDSDARAFFLTGVLGTATPSADTAAVTLQGSKKNGTTIQALADGETIYVVSNNGVVLHRVRGNGDMGIGAGTPAARLHVHQSTLGDPVQRLSSSATNDDPSEIVYQARVATTNATVTTLHTFTIPASTTYVIEVDVVGRRTGGAAGAAEDSHFRKFIATYKNVAGTATQMGFTNVATHSEGGWGGVTLSPTGATTRVQVEGLASVNITWHMTARVWQVGT